MDEQITQIEYFSNIREDPFYFDEHSSQVGFYNTNKETLDDLNEDLIPYSEGFMTYDGENTISVNYTTIFSDDHFRGIIDNDNMNSLEEFIDLLEGAAENIVEQQQEGGKKRKRSRKGRKSRKSRKSHKSRKTRRGRKSRKVRRGRKSGR